MVDGCIIINSRGFSVRFYSQLNSSCFKSYCLLPFQRHWLQNETGLHTFKLVLLLRAQLTNSTDTSRNCTTCPYIEHGRNQYTFHSTGETHHIKSHITCETFDVIYLMQCRLCNPQYIGETKRRLKDHFNEHRRPVLNPTGNYIHTVVSEHFLTSNHSDNHMFLIPIEKLKNGRDSLRKAREAHLIHKTKTIEPLGINKRDEL